MKLIYEPSVYLVGTQQLNDSNMQAFLDAHDVSSWDSDAPSDGEYLSESAGRLCYMSFAKPRPGGNKAYLEHILEVQHGSVIEHVVFNFILTGISRSLSHELVRHRSGASYSQLSQRYVDESVAEYVVPDALKEEVEDACESPFNSTAGNAWINAIQTAHASYVQLVEYLSVKLSYTCSQCGKPVALESLPCTCASCGGKAYHGTELRKAARQAARSVLPNATETKIFFTVNARALRHIIEMRASRHADVEIRKFAYTMWKVVVKECPNLFGDYEETSLPDGTIELTTKNRKV